MGIISHRCKSGSQSSRAILGLAIGSAIVVCSAISVHAQAELPAPPPADAMHDWSTPWDAGAPGVMSARSLLPAPAGKDGPVFARDGHFYTGEHRVKFWGVNVAFSGAFPTHEQADAVAERLANMGVNCVRFHHMDSRPFPGGIFADEKMETLSPEALDRLDYFTAALKRRGVYSNINLHVSRAWGASHKLPGADKLPDYDKMVDLFNPDLAAAQKQYAKDLLTHVNAYTKARYADEPAIAMVEINNEDTLFLWGGEKKLSDLPAPYADDLKKLWNAWVAKKYPAREALATAWTLGAQPSGENILGGPPGPAPGAAAAQPKPPAGGPIIRKSVVISGNMGSMHANGWGVEQHGAARVTMKSKESNDGHNSFSLTVGAVDGTDWHVMLTRPGIALQKDHYYTVSFKARRADGQVDKVGVGASMAHAPWTSLGFGSEFHVTDELKDYTFGFVASADEKNSRLTFALGANAGTIELEDFDLHEGGQLSLGDAEDPAKGSVLIHRAGMPETAQRSADWFDFLQQTDQAFFVEMRRYLREELGVKAPVTGTIGLGPLGTTSQAPMDFVDAHAYWDHPQFPHQPWSGTDWKIGNKPMVDDPASATLWGLAGTRVAGKPFTVTEYNHASPNEWQAECIPMIASYAALQDWDAIFLFAYSHNDDYQKPKLQGFFDVEGNPLKMAALPQGARIFLGGGVQPLAGERVVAVPRDEALKTASTYYHQMWPFLRDRCNVSVNDALAARLAVTFDGESAASRPPGLPPISWSGSIDGDNDRSAGSGQYVVSDPHAAVFVGFARKPEQDDHAPPIDCGSMTVTLMQSPFATITLVPSDPSKTIAVADRLLLSAVARGGNTGMVWDAARHSVGDKWGAAPTQVEIVKATIRVAGKVKAFALDDHGRRGAELKTTPQGDQTEIELGQAPTLWYELVRN